MSDDSGGEALQELPDHVKKYFTDRNLDYHKLDRLPETREVFLKLSPDEVGLLDRVGVHLESDFRHGHSVPEEEDASVAPGATLRSYVFAIH
jgi:hypothetical protein